jgi:hypothetical protein
MKARNIIDAMQDARAAELRKGASPKDFQHWTINRAGLRAMAVDPRITAQYSEVPLEDRPFMGIPIRVSEDRSDEWRFSLVMCPAFDAVQRLYSSEWPREDDPRP